ncbi:MAG: ATP-binding protein [Gammaproteobacteria bacterium]|nr:ATP-binding protein [Gammaproteobacteria bacterium]
MPSIPKDAFSPNLFSRSLPLGLAIAFIACSLLNYLLFHTLIELTTVAIGVMMCIAAWHTRHLLRNNTMLFLGYGYLWASLLNLTHVLTFPGLQIFPLLGAEVSIQFWLASRITEALVLFGTTLLLIKQNQQIIQGFIWLGVASLLLLVMITDQLINVNIPQSAITTFNNVSIYAVIGILLYCLWLQYRHRQQLSSYLYRFIFIATIFALLAQVFFSIAPPNAPPVAANVFGHIFEFLSYWTLFLAVVKHTLERPFAQMARDASSYDAIPEATLIVDNRGIIRQVNQATQRLAKQPATNLIGHHVHPLFHSKLMSEQDCPVCRNTRHQAQTQHFQMHHSNNVWWDICVYPISSGKTQAATVQVIVDLSDKIAADTRIQQLTTLIEQAPDVIAICTPQGALQYINPAGRALLKPDPLAHTDSVTLLSRFEQFASQMTMEQLIQHCTLFGNWTDECQFVGADNKTIIFHLTLIAHYTQNDSLDYISLIARDISEQKQQQQIIRHSQKMEAVGQLTSGVAHDFNNILSVILGYSQMLERKLPDLPQLRAYNREIFLASERACRLTAQLLAFSRKTDSRKQLDNVNAVITKMQDMLQQTLNRNISILTQLEKAPWPTYINRDELEDSLLNMAINAMHAMPDGGQLTIRTSNRNITPELARQLNISSGDHITIEVADTGCGIDEKILPRLFEPFFTTKGERGTGLGLSQVFGFAKRCQGTVQVHSIVGQGTTFTLYFPRSVNQANPAPPHDEVTQISSPRKSHILLVDPDPAVCRVASDVLSSNGHYVTTTYSSAQAKLLLSEEIQLLICDSIMPGESGLALAQYCSQQHPDQLRVILLCAHQMDAANLDAQLPDNAVVLCKPFTRQTLLALVDQQLQTNPTDSILTPA